MKAIYLTGFMGAGKTTIGSALGESMNLQVIDTDHFIEQEIGKTTKEIFEESGEATFRTYEKDYLRKLPLENVIITTGGGIILQSENREWMKQHGVVIYLHCDIEELYHRLKSDTTRPLLSGDKLEKITTIYAKRQPLYQEADLIIDTTNKSIPDVVEEITNKIPK